jgi:hypothetical protein
MLAPPGFFQPQGPGSLGISSDLWAAMAGLAAVRRSHVHPPAPVSEPSVCQASELSGHERDNCHQKAVKVCVKNRMQLLHSNFPRHGFCLLMMGTPRPCVITAPPLPSFNPSGLRFNWHCRRRNAPRATSTAATTSSLIPIATCVGSNRCPSSARALPDGDCAKCAVHGQITCWPPDRHGIAGVSADFPLLQQCCSISLWPAFLRAIAGSDNP